jgi:imidazolonepropionase-like amidohydrolase
VKNQPDPRLILRARRLFDACAGGIVEDLALEIQGGRIAALHLPQHVPPGLPVIDLGETTLVPGLIDCHTHLLMRKDARSTSFGMILLTKPTAYRALEGAANARATLHAGFTTVRDVESEGAGYADAALRDAIEAGLVEGPRMQVATRGIAATGGYFPLDVSADHLDFPAGAQMVTGADEARRAVREQIRHGADLIKIYVDFPRSFRDLAERRITPTLTIDEIRTVCEEAHAAQRRVAAHASSDRGILNALEGGVDSIEHGTFATRASLEPMAERGVFLIPTIGHYYYALLEATDDVARDRVRPFLEANKAALLAAHEAGVRIASGSDASGAATHGANARELVAMCRLGLPALDVMRAATISAADLLGWEDRVGALSPGRFADVVGVDGNPLEDITAFERVHFVMKQGHIIKKLSL